MKKASLLKLSKISRTLEEMTFEPPVEPLGHSDLMILTGALQGIVSGGLTLAWKSGLSEVWGIGLYHCVVRGEKLTEVEIIRQMLNASTEPDAFAAALRRLADQLCESPNVCGVEASKETT
jgi:hypothetical protein